MKKNVTLLLSTLLLASFFASCGLFDPIPKEEKLDNEPHFLTQIEMGGNNIKKGSFKDKIEISNQSSENISLIVFGKEYKNIANTTLVVTL